MSFTRVYLVDDHPLVLEAMKSRFNGIRDIEIVGSAASVERGLEELPGLRPDVLILDLRVDGMLGIPTIRRLVPLCRGIVLFTSRERDGLVEQLLEAGAAAHIEKTAELSSLDDAIAEAAVRPFGSAVYDQLPITTLLPHEQLSPREAEVYRLLASCRTPKQIAFDLGVAQSTAYTHIERVLTKLGIDSPTEVVRYASEYDLSTG